MGVLHHQDKTMLEPSGLVIKTPALRAGYGKGKDVVASDLKRGAPKPLSEEDPKVVWHYIGELVLELESFYSPLANSIDT